MYSVPSFLRSVVHTWMTYSANLIFCGKEPFPLPTFLCWPLALPFLHRPQGLSTVHMSMLSSRAHQWMRPSHNSATIKLHRCRPPVPLPSPPSPRPFLPPVRLHAVARGACDWLSPSAESWPRGSHCGPTHAALRWLHRRQAALQRPARARPGWVDA